MIHKTTYECAHSWCLAPFKVANAEGKYPAICRKCGQYTLLESKPEGSPDPTEYYRVENSFKEEEGDIVGEQGSTAGEEA